MRKVFDTLNAHTLIEKLLQTSTPSTELIKFIANYIKGRKANTTFTSFRSHKFIQSQVNADVPQGGVLSPNQFNAYTADIPASTAPVQVMLYADDIQSYPHILARVLLENTYNHTYIRFLTRYNITIFFLLKNQYTLLLY